MFSQNRTIDKDNKPFIIRGTIGIPKSISSNQFRTSFNGLYEGSLSVNFKLFNNTYIGVGYQSVNFQNNKFLKYKVFAASVPYNTHLIGNNPFVHLGFDKFYKSNFYMHYAINYGFMLGQFTNVNEDTTAYNKPFGSKKFTAQFVQPEVSANFIVEENLGFCVYLAYSTLFSKYDPKSPRFNQFEEVRDKSNNYYMSWVTFGFGFNVLLGKNK
ncbi:MAG: hypothetical protein JNM96_03675 [Bacteroidia bacterium]|nr:hypothetical protein [Bacteroidia bacterium]